MCLFPFMMGGRPNPENIAPPPAAKKMQNELYILGAVHSVMMIILMSSLGIPGLNELFNVMFLMCGTYSMNYCFMIFYIVIMFNDSVTYFTTAGYMIQVGDFAKCYDNTAKIFTNCNGF